MPVQDYYATLGVSKTATEKEIKAAFRKLARKYHPDVNPGDKAAEARFKEINEAYEVLSDPETRSKYDKYGPNWKNADQFEAARNARAEGFGPFGGGRWSSAGSSRTYNFDFSDFASTGGATGETAGGGFGDIFEAFFQRASSDARRGASARSVILEDVEHPVEISLEEAFAGAKRTLEIMADDLCAACNGTGRVGGKPCATCYATGTIRKPKRIEVSIPPGVATGSRVRIAGQGGVGPNGQRADLYLVITVRPHPRFERRGDDLTVEIDVPMLDAVLGGEVTVPTLRGGKLALKVPPETQNGRVIRLAGQGMPKLGRPGERGDLYAKVRVKLPTNLTARQRELLEQLRATNLG
ncbi:MAG: J domain-containing protein [Dehalococcoidia bacterium]|nr:J domain-containing protein [Dehalococcoidia bacterium]